MSRIGYAPGAFDLFHIGYLNLLREARSRCDFLIAGIVADDVLIAHKGIRPVIPLSKRLEIVRNIRCVDAALPATTNDKLEIWRELRFDILFKGDDWRGTEKGNRLERDLPISSGSVKQEESIPTMHLTGGPHCKERGKKVCSTANDAPRKRRFADPAKAAVMVYVERLVRNGLAWCSEMDDGIIELTLSSGEVFHLGKASVTRII
jgi:glycerol-3-phosphate cytidylyltransferase